MSTMTELQRRNAYHMYGDVFWYGVLAGSAMAFLGVYAARVGATAFQVGLLTAGPAVVNLLASLPAGRWLENRAFDRVTYLASVWHRLPYLCLIPLPVLLRSADQAWALALITLIMAVPGTLLAIAFNAEFADVVPPEWRGHVVGRRNALVAVSITSVSLLCGWLLDRIAFPLNFQIVFGVGAVGAALSSYHLGRLQMPATTPVHVGRPLHDVARPGLMRFADAMRNPPGLRFLARSRGQPLLRLDLVRGSFRPLLAAYLLFYAFQYVSVPIYPVFWVRELHLSDGAISLGNALFYGVMLLASLSLERVSARFGYHRVLTVGGLLYSLYPLFTGLATDARLYWVASLVGGGVWALANAGLVSRLMERVPDDDRPAYMALHNLAMNLGMLGGSAIGPFLGDWLGMRQTLLLNSAMRLVGGILLGLWG